MKGPELSFRDETNKEEALHSFDHRKLEDEYSINLTEKACDALHRFVLDKTSVGLAELHSDITERAYTLVESGSTPEDAIFSILEPIRVRLQEMLKTGKYAFRNEEIFDQLGKKLERGLLSDLTWLHTKFNESLKEGQTRQIYTNSKFDDDYAVDFIEAVWDISPENGELTLASVDLIQKKSNTRLTDDQRMRIVMKHEDFIRDNEMVMVELKSMEATEEQLRGLKEALGSNAETYLVTAFEEAYTGEAGEAEAYFASALIQFKKYLLSRVRFADASKALKRSYIEQLSFLDDTSPKDSLTSSLCEQLEAWKAEWSEAIGEKKKRILSPIKPIVTRSVISYANQEDQVEVIAVAGSDRLVSDLTKFES